MQLAEMVLKYQLDRKSKHKTEIGEIISEFVNEINKEREGTKYPKVTYMQIYTKLGAVNTKLGAVNKDKFALNVFLSECRDYKRRNGSFGKLFYAKTQRQKQNAKKQPK